MENLTVLMPGEVSERLHNMLLFALEGYEYDLIKTSNEIVNLKNKKILFVVELGESGINIELYRFLEKIIKSGDNFMENSVGSVIVNVKNELYSRDIGRKIIFHANNAGCIFPGRPLSEATGSLKNYNTYKKIHDMSLYEICLQDCKKTVNALMNYNVKKIRNPNILTLHSSNYTTSNTLLLWKMVKDNLKDYNINEIHIENGSIHDCKACSYKACKHYSESTNCFYGGIMVEEIYPAIIDCDILIMLCPNYNDAISANMSAAINRLTALFRKVKFYDKYIFSIIVSGHSGSDILAQQLISALNINKTFMLPPKFALMETANDIGEIKGVDNIKEKAAEFAKNIRKCIEE
ncbi:flavodoxin family protein [Sedimentibacter sp. MB31-C6]|uniref:flavodoxin family protein n=1 Tax=Sedimentibacter sp. MB31-C6 TaxID=3109366 RepID=UPI002DDCCA89|nr:NAD(P)H-dependent oxidoreductase [Sedimentibacter sp. MB36-C1]WSI04693.1 NAD(P)H-dependent oxidoreductase [Sedimentibacter sp. MB36-C1]